MKSLNMVLLFSLFICGNSLAQDAKFTVELSQDSILMGNYFQIKFTLENAQSAKFDPPTFEGFRIVGGPNHASSFSMVNGTVSQNVSYSYYLEPTDIGNYFIEPAMIDTGEEILESSPIEVIVLDNPEGIKQQPGQMQRKELEFTFPEEFRFKTPKKPKKKRKVYRI